ncbi:hypothetical protein QE422_002051 [Chryseobacterium sp. SORGH_AS 447]|uniref:hypothetical protein n=1 Tax=Chryseobacterium sp. SORGH_AS_0447 TaxID=3041769 RepID=UPI0027883533|nr:hypothetical protein [Chryseobacterium sp. SORGH_AS_0447]MDQ1161683.1 hypothetical protein [Chryseobacterium sp. SORGH_AS_0447]
MNKIFIGAVIALSLFSCDTSKKKELELKQKELELKEKELNLEISKLKKVDSVSAAKASRISEEALVKEGLQKPNDPEVSNINNLLGYWVDNQNGNIAMYFDRDGTFVFKDLNSSREKYEDLTGTYKLNAGKLTLLYDDRAQQNFRFIKENFAVPVYYIQKDRYLMVKAVEQ